MNALHYAVGLGFPIMTTEGRSGVNPDVWLSRFENKRGDHILVGYDHGAKRWVVDACGLFGVAIAEGARVELHPGCDLWMRGARFGTVRKIVGDVATVRMDNARIRKLQHFALENLRLAR